SRGPASPAGPAACGRARAGPHAGAGRRPGAGARPPRPRRGPWAGDGTPFGCVLSARTRSSRSQSWLAPGARSRKAGRLPRLAPPDKRHAPVTPIPHHAIPVAREYNGGRGGAAHLSPGMKIAAIDLGSNSFHMVIVETSARGGFRVIAGEKEMVRLGASTLSRGRISATAMRRGLDVLRKYKRIARTQGVDKTIAVATSAVREARNGEDFLDRVGREIGVWPKAISGEGEARLIYLAALHSIHLEGRRALVIDIGGGSVELALGEGGRLEWVASEKLGVLRMAAAFGESDPLGRKAESRLVDRVEHAIEAHAEHVREKGFDAAIGTSGTILALGRMAHHMETGELPEALHHLKVSASTLRELRQ